MRPKTEADKEIFGIWCDAGPSDAFIAGVPGYAGRVLIPSTENVSGLRRRITETQSRCESESQRKLLACIDTYLTILEPASAPGMILDAFFGHLIREGIKPNHMAPLAEHGKKALEAYVAAKRKGLDWPVGLKLLAMIRCDGLLELLQVVESNTKNRALRQSVNGLMAGVKDFEKHVHVEGFGAGTFDEVWRLIRERGCALNRESIYPQALRDLYDYSESPAEVEGKGLRFLRNELSAYKQFVEDFANRLGCDPRSEAIAATLKKSKSLQPKKAISFINRVRKLTGKIVNKRIVGINPEYSTKVVETPPYLSGVLPSGAAFFMDYLTTRPKQIFVATMDPRRDPVTVPSELINLLIHEEYGHCVHDSNSAKAYGSKPMFCEMLGSTLGGAVSEGLSFQRELEFLEYLNKLGEEPKLLPYEKAFIKFCKPLGGFETIRAEYEFYTRMWRFARFLRVIGDARINSGKQGLADFIEWANQETGLSRRLVYFQVFPAHQGIGPGYASTYAIVGESIREIQNAAKTAGKDIVKFNTYASSQGFVPRSVFEGRLRKFAEAY